MLPHALVDSAEVVEHLVRLLDLFFQKAQERRHAVLRHPKRGYMIVSFLGCNSRTKPVADFLDDCRNGDHTSSVSRNTVIFFREGCIRSRIEGRGARVVS
jgi:hypothetical protein